MSAVSISKYLADCRELAIAEIRRMIPADSALGPVLYDLMLEYPLRGAKGLRPALCLAVCRALGGAEQAALPSAAVIELYHNAFLIHDDIEDGSLLRRDGPTLHSQHGIPIAINVGDAMLALALEPLLENSKVVGLGQALRILQVIGRMARETAEGQAIELNWIRARTWQLSDADYRGMVLKKTGWYSFIAPMKIGAIVAGASGEQLASLEQFAADLSVAFQIRDDVLNLEVDNPGYGKEWSGDLWEGKHTLLLLHALRSVTPNERAQIEQILRKRRPRSNGNPVDTALLSHLEATGDLTRKGRARLEAALEEGNGDLRPFKTSSDVELLHARIRETGGSDYAQTVGKSYALRARAALDRARPWLPKSVHSELLYALVDFTIERRT
jgi:geranylgeranyl diphosphate synthase, type II